MCPGLCCALPSPRFLQASELLRVSQRNPLLAPLRFALPLKDFANVSVAVTGYKEGGAAPGAYIAAASIAPTLLIASTDCAAQLAAGCRGWSLAVTLCTLLHLAVLCTFRTAECVLAWVYKYACS